LLVIAALCVLLATDSTGFGVPIDRRVMPLLKRDCRTNRAYFRTRRSIKVNRMKQ